MITQRQATASLCRKKYRFRNPRALVKSPIRRRRLGESFGATFWRWWARALGRRTRDMQARGAGGS